MDRQIVYPAAVPLETDILQPQVNAMVALGYLAQAILGTAAVCDGLAAVARSPAAMTIDIGPGSLTQLSTVDATAFGSLPANTAPLLKLGINTAALPLTFAAPGTAGQSQNFLIEAAFSETDAVPVALPYYNAANPAVSFSGPNNTGVPQNTQRLQTVAIQVKPGTPAAAGSQTTPAADAGWLPLYVVTLTAGQTSITQASIATHPGSPALPWKLPQLDPGFSRMQAFSASGTFTPPLGCTAVRIRMWGGGGGGGGSYGPNSGGAAGAGGGYAEGILNVAQLVPMAVTVGTGGAAGAGTANASTNTGATGGTSSFGTMSATGGAGGGGGNATFQLAGSTGGLGSGGALAMRGNSGGTAYTVGSAVSVGVGGGTFGTSNGAPNVVVNTQAVSPGNGAGGGGNGGAIGGAGGAGAQGLVIVEF